MSWSILKQAFKNKEMRKKLFVVLAMIAVYRALAHIPVPLAEPAQLRELVSGAFNSQDLLGFIDVLNGGALQNFSIMLMGLGPYITSSIIFQLLGKAVPQIEEIQKDGEAGRRRISSWTRWATLPLAIVQSFGLILFIQIFVNSIIGVDITESATTFDWLLMISSLVGGSMLLMWLGELMTEEGVGNGISLLIIAAVISQLPSTIGGLIGAVTNTEGSFSIFGLYEAQFNPRVLITVSVISLFILVLTYAIVKLNEAQRAITISYAKRVQGNRAYGGVDSVLPIKLIAAGVIPIIFATAFISVPAFVGSFLESLTTSNRLLDVLRLDLATANDWGANLTQWFGDTTTGHTASGGYTYSLILFLLVVAFTFFYTNLNFNAKDVAENLQKQGGFVPGIRPGKQTEKYLSSLSNKLTLFGAVALGLIAILPSVAPIIIANIAGLNFTQDAQILFGGTSLLITVSVAIETLRQIESKALMVTYDTEDAK